MKKVTKKKTKKKVEDFIYNDSWIYSILLGTLLVLMESLKTFYFTVKGISLSYSILLLPFIYFIINYVAKKYDYKKAVTTIILSATLFICLMGIISFGLGERMTISKYGGEILAYFISQFINLTIYLFLLNNTKSPYILLLMNYLFALIVYYMIYMVVYLDLVLTDQYWLSYFVTLGIQLFICMILSIIDKFTKKGKA